ncbi:hypothetical protein CLF_111209 [Clonorchis sinensis]|uniref:Uncharacterized protein n=1 Tax=Clonorchis sinensis TaxID=79923 RepID=G7YUI0_CLOSI|nr:hypothetical protein CLF_111209 [Clonorchis sinensis]
MRQATIDECLGREIRRFSSDDSSAVNIIERSCEAEDVGEKLRNWLWYNETDGVPNRSRPHGSGTRNDLSQPPHMDIRFPSISPDETQCKCVVRLERSMRALTEANQATSDERCLCRTKYFIVLTFVIYALCYRNYPSFKGSAFVLGHFHKIFRLCSFLSSLLNFMHYFPLVIGIPFSSMVAVLCSFYLLVISLGETTTFVEFHKKQFRRSTATEHLGIAHVGRWNKNSNCPSEGKNEIQNAPDKSNKPSRRGSRYPNAFKEGGESRLAHLDKLTVKQCQKNLSSFPSFFSFITYRIMEGQPSNLNASRVETIPGCLPTVIGYSCDTASPGPQTIVMKCTDLPLSTIFAQPQIVTMVKWRSTNDYRSSVKAITSKPSCDCHHRSSGRENNGRFLIRCVFCRIKATAVRTQKLQMKRVLLLDTRVNIPTAYMRLFTGYYLATSLSTAHLIQAVGIRISQRATEKYAVVFLRTIIWDNSGSEIVALFSSISLLSGHNANPWCGNLQTNVPRKEYKEYASAPMNVRLGHNALEANDRKLDFTVIFYPWSTAMELFTGYYVKWSVKQGYRITSPRLTVSSMPSEGITQAEVLSGHICLDRSCRDANVGCEPPATPSVRCTVMTELPRTRFKASLAKPIFGETGNQLSGPNFLMKVSSYKESLFVRKSQEALHGRFIFIRNHRK